MADLWYALPLIVSISLVLSSARHERTSLILSGALRTAFWVTVFMGIIMAILYLVSRQL